MGCSFDVSERTHGPTLEERRGLGPVEHARLALGLEHVLDFDDALAEFEGQVPLLVAFQGAIVTHR